MKSSQTLESTLPVPCRAFEEGVETPMSYRRREARALSPGSVVVDPTRRLAHLLVCSVLTTGLTLAALAAVAGNVSASRGRKTAGASGKQSFFYENATLSLRGENGSLLVERGYAHGTYNAPVSCSIRVTPGHDIKASYAIYPPGGSVSGEANARYVVKGKLGYFGGYMTIKKATGRYRHFSGGGIGFSGLIDRYSYKVTIKVHGWLSH